MDILKKYKDIETNVEELKNILYDKYTNTYNNNKSKIIQILKNQGKYDLFNQLITRTGTDFQSILLSDGYWLTNLDLWILAKHFNLPIIMTVGGRKKGNSKTSLEENNANELLLGDNTGEEYIMIKKYGTVKNKPQKYALLDFKDETVGGRTISINKDKFTDEWWKSLNENQATIEEFINSTKIIITRIRKNKI